MKNIFEQDVANELIARVNKLTPEVQPQWGKMNVSQMFAHLNVPYDMALTDKYPPASGFSKFLVKIFGVKEVVVGPKPYPKNGRTAPEFLITDEREFELEKTRLIENINKTRELGESHFNGKESRSFGSLTKGEWSNLFYKHNDHHLTQFGV